MCSDINLQVDEVFGDQNLTRKSLSFEPNIYASVKNIYTGELNCLPCDDSIPRESSISTKMIYIGWCPPVGDM